MKNIYSPVCMTMFVSLMCFTLVGCGDAGPELGTVKGKVTFYGRPLEKAVVTFEPEGGGPVGVGPTDAEGNYELYSAGKKGAKVGNHRVVITTIREVEGEPASAVPMSSNDPAYEAQALGNAAQYKKAETFKEKIPAKYNAASELKQEVTSGANEVNFDLK